MVNEEKHFVFKHEHVSVLVNEVIYWISPSSGKSYIDCTLGMSGIAKKILDLSNPDGKLLGIDTDSMAIEKGKKVLDAYGSRVELRHGSYDYLKSLATQSGFSDVDGIVFDLGVSTPQLMDAERGFSFMNDGPLDMRMDQSSGITAEEFLARVSEKELEHVLREYGEERFARRIARAIVETRQTPIKTTKGLSEIIRRAIPVPARRGRIHYATRTFQALRIVVNQELKGLAGALRDASRLLRPGGRLCVIAFHSLEDRIVKQTFRELSAKPAPTVNILTKKPITPSREEQLHNPRSRSAKLRVVERLGMANT
ncbi:MAG: 16S rRNA (cytosine(1402)-N(4))-methyltransferase RsmH [Nitrospirales bacterium]|nr:16S rRNA (cytosine(1402)-N(4))-methyltransferase RsmH [Nitrospira sp.]MDR4500473.1 16S rRNA (cytosine(1402)-N(4))-methyltransferase RsmH [Nitrospirales bacterium]